jgi:hypothetical protein
MSTTKTVLGVIFIDGEHKGLPSGKKIYNYAVPDFITATPNKGDHVVVLGGDNRMTMARVETLVTEPSERRLATKNILGTIDLSGWQKHKQAVQRKQQLLSTLTALDKRRKQLAVFEDLAKTDPDAHTMLQELKAMQEPIDVVEDDDPEFI